MTCILKSHEKSGAKIKATTNCGRTIETKSRMDVFGPCTAWTSLADCPACLATQHPPRLIDVARADA